MYNTRARTAILGLMLCASVTRAQETLYGVTDTNLVRLNPGNPADVEIIGPHGLTPSELAGQTLGAFSMTYDRGDDRLLGLYYTRDGLTGAFDQYLVEYDRTTGAASVVALLANSLTNGYVESIEYDDALSAVLVSRDPVGTNTRSIETLNADGTTTPLIDDGRDNDYAVYDPTRDRFYTIDPNDVGWLTLVDLTTGQTTDLGPVYSSTGDMAYSERSDQVFACDVVSGQLVSLGNGTAARLPSMLGVIGGDPIQGLAVVDDGAPLACPVDFDGDGLLTANDLAVFWSDFRRGDKRADLNGDGSLNRSDMIEFIHDFLAGC